MLSACGESSMKGVLGQSDAQGVSRAEIVFKGSAGVMDVEFNQGVPWPNVHTEVEVTSENGIGYVIKRKDNGMKLHFIPEAKFSSAKYVCSECPVYTNGDTLPLLWVLKN